MHLSLLVGAVSWLILSICLSLYFGKDGTIETKKKSRTISLIILPLLALLAVWCILLVASGEDLKSLLKARKEEQKEVEIREGLQAEHNPYRVGNKKKGGGILGAKKKGADPDHIQTTGKKKKGWRYGDRPTFKIVDTQLKEEEEVKYEEEEDLEKDIEKGEKGDIPEKLPNPRMLTDPDDFPADSEADYGDGMAPSFRKKPEITRLREYTGHETPYYENIKEKLRQRRIEKAQPEEVTSPKLTSERGEKEESEVEAKFSPEELKQGSFKSVAHKKKIDLYGGPPKIVNHPLGGRVKIASSKGESHMHTPTPNSRGNKNPFSKKGPEMKEDSEDEWESRQRNEKKEESVEQISKGSVASEEESEVKDIEVDEMNKENQSEMEKIEDYFPETEKREEEGTQLGRIKEDYASAKMKSKSNQSQKGREDQH